MNELSRCEVIPQPHQQAAFLIDGHEVTRWHFGIDAPRPYFYPLVGPQSGRSLTRMGHPGAENHDHHQSCWFAHNKVLGIDFWGNRSTAVIRQHNWYVYDDSDDDARMAVRLDWLDGHDPQPLLEQDLIVVMRPLERGEFTLDLQSTFRPSAESLEFQQTNFGFFAVRVAKSISGHFGGGTLTASTGLTSEKAIFGTAAEWMDYSGPMPLVTADGGRKQVSEGITLFDHPDNPSYPSKWHVREDGWMGPSACRDAPLVTTRESPLRLRYLLHIHRDGANAERSNQLAADWKQHPWLTVVKSKQPGRQYGLE
ncbi:MAG: PmoA family protein [Planctomycetaceae bacterium]